METELRPQLRLSLTSNRVRRCRWICRGGLFVHLPHHQLITRAGTLSFENVDESIQRHNHTAFRAANAHFFKLLKAKNKFHVHAPAIEEQSRDALRCGLTQRLEARLGESHPKRFPDAFHSFLAQVSASSAYPQILRSELNAKFGLNRRRPGVFGCLRHVARTDADSVCLPSAYRKKPDKFGFNLFVSDEAPGKLLEWKRRQFGELCPARFLFVLGDQQTLMKFRHDVRGELSKTKIYLLASIRHFRLCAGTGERNQVSLKV